MRQGSTPLSHGLLSVDAKARQTVWQRQNFYSVSTLLLLAGTFAGCSTELTSALTTLVFARVTIEGKKQENLRQSLWRTKATQL
jgi:hypothetical protein